MGDIGGEEGSEDLGSMPLNEIHGSNLWKLYGRMLNKEKINYNKRPNILNENLMINESLNKTLEELSKKINEESELDKLLQE
jgi:hypothetical protein